MKLIVKKILKMLLVLITSTIIIYLTFTIIEFHKWCKKNQISMFLNSDELLLNIDSETIQGIGDTVGNFAQLMEESLEEPYEEGYEPLALYYDPLGYSVWSYMQDGISYALTKYLAISILSGVAITIAYAVITSKKINSILKITLGYFGVMLIVPQILFLTYFYRFFGIFMAYYSTPNIEYFYIGYTAIFVLMYIINYRVGIRMTRELNQAIKDK